MLIEIVYECVSEPALEFSDGTRLAGFSAIEGSFSEVSDGARLAVPFLGGEYGSELFSDGALLCSE